MAPESSTPPDVLPRRLSLVAQTVMILRRNLEAGEWREFLPGEMELCERFQISRVTLRAALEQLQREKWIKGGQGRRRRILVQPKGKAARTQSHVVVLLSPVSILTLPTSVLFWVDALREHLASAGYRLEFHASQACYSQQPERAIESVAAQMRAVAWVLYLSTEAMQRKFCERQLPCVIAGSPHPNIGLPSVDVDYAAACRHAAGMLVSRGRRRLALLMPRGGQAGNLQSEAGFREACEGAHNSGVEMKVIHHKGTPMDVCRRLDDLLRPQHAADGLLVAKPLHVVTAVSHLLRRGVSLGKDLALISRDNDPFLECVVPTVARYERTPEAFARKVSRLVLDLVREGSSAPHHHLLMPSFVEGETLGPRVKPVS